MPAKYICDFNSFGCPSLAFPMNEDAPPDLHSLGQRERLTAEAEGKTQPSWSGQTTT